MSKAILISCALAFILPNVPLRAETLWLSSLDLSIPRQAGLAKIEAARKGQPPRIAGQKFDRAIAGDSELGLTFYLDGKASRFTAVVGVDDFITRDPGSVDFQVWGDGRLLWHSGLMRRGDPAKRLDVPLTGIRKMDLVAWQTFQMQVMSEQTIGSCGNYDHVDWAEASMEVADGFRPRVMDVEYDDPIKATAGHSVSRLATPVGLPYEKELPGAVTDYVLMSVGNLWALEYQLQYRYVPADGMRLVQMTGRSCQGVRPWLMLCNSKTGQGIAATIAYSGNWSMEIVPKGERTILRLSTIPAVEPFDNVGGMPIPGALISEFTGHWDYGAQPIVRFIREKLCRDPGDDWPPVQYNDWYASKGKSPQEFLSQAAKVAAELGCELYTVDAGWYGSDGERSWNTQVGDWRENKARLPAGLAKLSDDVHALGMKFGLWVEIECANESTPIGKEHPDWHLRAGNRMVSKRGALDFGKPQALAWAKSEIDRLVTTYNLDYIKMDFNTDLPIRQPVLGNNDDPLPGHYRGLAELWRHMRATHPKLIVENCASGSLRQDAMTAAYTDTHWVSDNIENNACLSMNFGATYLFPPEICSHWTTKLERDNPALDLESQFTVNMMGHFGLSGKITEWDAATRKVAAERIALYKKLRPLLRKADVYHLTPQASMHRPRGTQAALYVEPSIGKAMLFAFQGNAGSLQSTIRLRGLREDWNYRLVFPAGFGPDRNVNGRELVQDGLKIAFPHAGASAVIEISPE